MRVMTDVVGPRYWTLIAEMEVSSLAAFEEMSNNPQGTPEDMKKFEELMKGYHDLVDHGIVLVETIYSHIEEGSDPRTASIEGAEEVAGVITSYSIHYTKLYETIATTSRPATASSAHTASCGSNRPTPPSTADVY